MEPKCLLAEWVSKKNFLRAVSRELEGNKQTVVG